MVLFREARIEDLFVQNERQISNYIMKLDVEDVLNIDTTILSEQIVEKCSIPVKFDIETDTAKLNVYLNNIPTAMLRNQGIFSSKPYCEMAAVDYTFNISGNIELLKYQPKIYSNWTYNADIKGTTLTISIQTRYANTNLNEETEQFVKTSIQEVLYKINENISNIQSDCNAYNMTLREKIISQITAIKQQIIAKQDQETRLNPFK